MWKTIVAHLISDIMVQQTLTANDKWSMALDHASHGTCIHFKAHWNASMTKSFLHAPYAATWPMQQCYQDAYNTLTARSWVHTGIKQCTSMWWTLLAIWPPLSSPTPPTSKQFPLNCSFFTQQFPRTLHKPEVLLLRIQLHAEILSLYSLQKAFCFTSPIASECGSEREWVSERASERVSECECVSPSSISQTRKKI
jgi:hypothetical protein